ncbi:hypothetical protein ACFQI7_01490 [Paenibacillus allorhizosphaerae]|uniref:Twin-arginine translocation signal domain-containing protein n=1 Tax=Paenibacillus allorhizosphaerae TaxID=2849866 RepID=A0ABM8VAE5_9BACL|nr:hypothetical protein [Paenibacillus allorhizosphaerae]CAG7616161.1 hypothetical protein PAECIP111802_00255 [Paenibacillus allorhizosphaerae]
MSNSPSKEEGMQERKPKAISRRDALKYVGSGIAAGAILLSGAGFLSRSGKASDETKQPTPNQVAGEPILLTVDTSSRGHRIPSDFSGLSFEVGPLVSGNAGVEGYLFSPENSQLITLFQNIGIKNLRVGGGSVDQRIPAGTGSDGYAGIDNLFAFAKAAGVKVIYTFRMLNPAAKPVPNLIAGQAAIAQYIWQRYQPYLSSFAVGNEPDWKSYHHYPGHPNDPLIYETVPGVPGSAYPSYLETWRAFADAIRELAPGAKFSGPDTGDYGTGTFTPDRTTGVSWTQRFAENEANSGRIAEITQHYYVGASPGVSTIKQAIDNMLSPDWVNKTEVGTQSAGTGTAVTTYTPYPWLYSQIIAPMLKAGIPYRMTESNDYLTGVPGASNAFASALWALDYMHWWAAHQASGVNFHNKQWIYTCTIVMDPSGNFQTTPKGYGIKAFNLGSNGFVMPVTISNPNALNLTAYAVGEGHNLYVTIINKTQGEEAKDASVTIVPSGFQAKEASSTVLASGIPGGHASVKNAMLGEATINNSGQWSGTWTKLDVGKRGKVTLTVQAMTAAIVRIHG